MFLTSAKPTIRFAAVKTLNRIAMIHPDAVTSCNVDLENLISDSNRSIATLAITTLLKVREGFSQRGVSMKHHKGGQEDCFTEEISHSIQRFAGMCI